MMQSRFAVDAPRGGLTLAAVLRHQQYQQSHVRIDAALHRDGAKASSMQPDMRSRHHSETPTEQGGIS